MMSDRHYLDDFGSDAVDEAKRKPRKHDAARAVLDEWPTFRGFHHPFHNEIHLLDECSRGDRTAVGVPRLGFENLRLCGGTELEPTTRSDAGEAWL